MSVLPHESVLHKDTEKLLTAFISIVLKALLSEEMTVHILHILFKIALLLPSFTGTQEKISGAKNEGVRAFQKFPLYVFLLIIQS